MANAALLLENLADSGELTASAEATGMGITQLIASPHIFDDLWQANADSANFTLDLGEDTDLDTVTLLGMTGSDQETARLRVSSDAGGPTSGDLLDTGALGFGSANFDYRYGMFVYPLTALVSARYVRFDLEDSGAGRVQAGRLVVGVREAFDYNFTPGSGFGWGDLSGSARAKGGQVLDWERRRFRTCALNFDFISNEQRWDMVEALGREKGNHGDALALLDPAASNLPQRTIWGRMTDASPIAWSSAIDIYSKQFEIEERL